MDSSFDNKIKKHRPLTMSTRSDKHSEGVGGVLLVPSLAGEKRCAVEAAGDGILGAALRSF